MRIERRAITEAVMKNIFLLEREDERYLIWEKFVFWDEQDKLRDDFPARIPLSILMILFVIVTSLALLYQWRLYQVFASEGIPALEVLETKDSNALRGRTYSYLRYRYTYGEESYTLTRNVSLDTYENAELGTSRDVLILLSNPEFIVANLDDLFFPLIFTTIAFTLACCLCIFYFYRWYRPVLLLPAKITEVERSEKHSNRGVHPIFEISYELTSPKTKKLLKGKRSIPTRQNAPTIEQLLAVLYVSDKDLVPL
jgi:hypothetical protein